MSQNKANWFVRILLIFLCLFIGGIISYNFLCTAVPGDISAGLIVLVFCLVILVLSEAFDNFSIVKLFSLSRSVREKEEQNVELKRENAHLRDQILSITTTISQKQVNSTVVVTDELAKMLSVRRADEPEREEKQKTEMEEQSAGQNVCTNEPPKNPTARRFINSGIYEDIALRKLLEREGLEQFPLIRDAKFTNLFQQIDPISECSPIFDGYIKTVDAEIFIEMKLTPASFFTRERIYLMLSKIHYYRTVKKVNAFLYLVMIRRDDGEASHARMFDYAKRIYTEFEPALANGLLKIKEYSVSDKEYEARLKLETGARQQGSE